MAKIRDARGREGDIEQSGYYRLTGSADLAKFFSKTQAAAIKSGNELEQLIWEAVHQIPDLNAFILSNYDTKGTQGVLVCRKNDIARSTIIQRRNSAGSKLSEPDFVGFDGERKKMYIVELKDGDTFDTKKAQIERENLLDFQTKVAVKMPFISHIFICCFNALDREQAFNGLKKRFAMDEILTGDDFGRLFGFDTSEIRSRRNGDVPDNVSYCKEFFKKYLNG